MSVSNGQNANQTTFNNAFVSKTVNSTTVGQVTLNNADVSSGGTITNMQRELNSLASFCGKATNVAFDAIPIWTDSSTGASSDDLFDRADALTVRLANHTHSGASGQGGEISALDLGEFNSLFGIAQRLSYTGLTPVSGTSFDFSDIFAGKTPGGSSSSKGVFASGSFRENVVRIRYQDRPVTDAAGLEIYGRFNVTGGVGTYVWTVDFFVNEPGSGETSATMPSLDAAVYGVDLYFMEVFDAQTRPTVTQELTNLLPLGGTGGGGGAVFGGLSLEPGFVSANEDYTGPTKEWLFDPDENQDIRAVVVVPDSYTTGQQIFANFIWTPDEDDDDVEWKLQSDLYRPGTNFRGITTVTDSDTVIETVVSADEIHSQTMNVTDSAGNINLTEVAVGDLIVLNLTRMASASGDTNAGIVRLVSGSFKVGT